MCFFHSGCLPLSLATHHAADHSIFSFWFPSQTPPRNTFFLSLLFAVKKFDEMSAKVRVMVKKLKKEKQQMRDIKALKQAVKSIDKEQSSANKAAQA